MRRKLALLCVLVVLCVYVVVQVATRTSLGIPKSEYEALIGIHHNTNGERWFFSGAAAYKGDVSPYQGWPVDDGKPCTWSGVECANGHVIRLNLGFRGIGCS